MPAPASTEEAGVMTYGLGAHLQAVREGGKRVNFVFALRYETRLQSPSFQAQEAHAGGAFRAQ